MSKRCRRRPCADRRACSPLSAPARMPRMVGVVADIPPAAVLSGTFPIFLSSGPRLDNSTRKVLPREARELEELKAIGKFKARPVDRRVRALRLRIPSGFRHADDFGRLWRAGGTCTPSQVFESAGDLGVPKLRKNVLTEPKVRALYLRPREAAIKRLSLRSHASVMRRSPS